MLQLLHISDVVPLHVLSYSYLALVLLRSIRKSKPKLGRQHFFRGSLLIGSFISFFAALTLLLIQSLIAVFDYHYLPLDSILAEAIPEAGMVFITGCVASLLFWRLLRYPKLQI